MYMYVCVCVCVPANKSEHSLNKEPFKSFLVLLLIIYLHCTSF